MSRGRRFAFAFVCHAGEWEQKAVLLAASLRRYAPERAELFAVVPGPEPVWGEPAALTLAALEDLEVQVVREHNPFGGDRPNMAKALTLKAPFSSDRLVCLDTDIMAMAPFRDDPLFDADVVAKPVDVQTWTGDLDAWRRTYEVCGLEMPAERVTTTVSGEESPPLFNAGVLVLREPVGLFDHWRRCALAMAEAQEDLPFRQEVWTNQPALALAIQAARMTVGLAGEDLNYPAHLRPLPRTGPPPVLCHYHWPRVVRAEPELRAAAATLARRHPRVAEVLGEHQDWAPLLRDPVPPRRRPPRDILVSGISRSGTSYLCNLLHRHSNCVAVIDPPPLVNALSTQPVPWGVAAYIQETRAAVVSGQPVLNKVDGALPTEDTFPRDEYSEYQPAPDTPDFVLVVKNVRALLARLEAVLALLDDARLVLCVRDPYDALASWKRTFPHLRDADVWSSESVEAGQSAAARSRSRRARRGGGHE